MKLLAIVGKLLVGIATFVLLVGFTLFAFGGYLTTLPLMKLTPRGRRIQAGAGLFLALMALGRAYSPDPSRIMDAFTEEEEEGESES